MLIVMSDLHLAESKSLRLGAMQFNHNLPADVYQEFFREIAESLDDGVVPEVDLVLAGDVFELTRSALWLEDSLRPYGHLDDIAAGSAQGLGARYRAGHGIGCHDQNR